ncbi:MAG: 2-octaprenyl-6-methoxyphenyl hydroxylase [Woeseia sp.]
MTRKIHDYDIVIAGGGMIGSSLALALAPLKLRIAVVEPVVPADKSQPSFDDRSTALSRSSQRMFVAIGIWPNIVDFSTPITSIHVSDKGRFGFSHINADQQGVDALGYVVINRALGEILRKALNETDRLETICPGKVTAVDLHQDLTSVQIEKPDGKSQRLTCNLLVAADGANSVVRKLAGIGASRIDYDQLAVVGNLQPEKPPMNRAFERFTDTGPLALLPVADDRAAFVWTLPSAKADEVMHLTDEAFTNELQAVFGLRLGIFSRVGRRAAYPLALSKASRLVAGRCVLIGNAAHGLHPVAAQGFNLGLRDVAALSDCIADARPRRDASFDVGKADILDEFVDWRRADQRKLVRITDGIVRVFGSASAPVGVLRNLGMLGFDLVPGVRSLFAKHMMGLAGPLPRLSRGVPLE